jgi:hypothetical protein
MSKSVYEMRLHETIFAEDANLASTVLRVPGGWVYRSYDKSHNILGSVFVPFNNEFQSTPVGSGAPVSACL